MAFKPTLAQKRNRRYRLLLNAGPSGPVDPEFANVTFLANFDGADGDTAYTSEDSAERVGTFAGTFAQLDDAQAKFGDTALYTQQNPDTVTFPNSTDFDLSNGDFTIELWIQWQAGAATGNSMLISQWDGPTADRSWALLKIGANLRFDYNNLSTALTAAGGFVDDTWHHIAVVRDTNVLEFFVDGSSIGSAALTATFNNSANKLNVSFEGSSNLGVNGWIDSVRITKGVARYTADFTPPTDAFPTS